MYTLLVFITRLVERVTTVGLSGDGSNRGSWLRSDKDIDKVSFDNIKIKIRLF